MSAADLHAVLDWRDTLVRLGIPEEALTGRHTACPACGGRDRFRYDDWHGRGGYFCNGCGAGDGFDLLQRVYGWSFAEARRAVEESAGAAAPTPPRRPSLAESASEPARPGGRIRAEHAVFGGGAAAPPSRPRGRVLDLLRTSCPVADCDDVLRYLAGRHLLPVPDGLRAHASAEYWHERQCIGRFSALLAPVRDIDGALVSLHVTYVQDGRKLADHEPRKLLGPLRGRVGCAVRLGEPEGVLGIAEGVETAVAAFHVHGVPTWAALSAAVLAKFQPPADVTKLVIFADRDVAGLEAAWKLRDRLKIECELEVPKPPAKDWADVLEVQR